MRYEFDLPMEPVRPKPAPSARPVRQPPLRRSLVLAHQMADYMASNGVATLAAFCKVAGITRARGTQIANLLGLSPKIQEEILCDRIPRLEGITEWTIRPLLREPIWSLQQEAWERLLLSQPSSSPHTGTPLHRASGGHRGHRHGDPSGSTSTAQSMPDGGG